MKESEENIKDLANILKNGDEKIILEAIDSLRFEEPFDGALKMLAEFYDNTENIEIGKNIEKFFNDLKNNTLKGEVVEACRLPLKQSTIKMVVSSCWQSGLDYSDFLEDFAFLFVKTDFEIALECLTVIEEMFVNVDAGQRKKIASIIEKTGDKDKKLLAKGILETLEN
jgi:hypothetical protein